MAQPIVHNFRVLSLADLGPRQPGYFEHKEGWHEWDGTGKHDAESFAGNTPGCIRLSISDSNIQQFPYKLVGLVGLVGLFCFVFFPGLLLVGRG